MPLLTEKGIGHERITREMLIVMVDNLNTQLGVEDAKWTTLDAELAQKLEIEYVPCLSNKVEKPNFYFGHRPSLIEAPVISYPNVSVYTNRTVASADQGDHMEGFQISVGIEAMCIAGPYQQLHSGFMREGEDLVNKRTQRMAESIHAVVLANRTLTGLVAPIGTPPRVDFSEVFTRNEGIGGQGAMYYWQMVRLEYFVNKVSSLY